MRLISGSGKKSDIEARCTQIKQQEALTEITGDTNIAIAIDQYPEILDVFLEFGFKQLSNPVARKTVAKMFTIKQATKIHPVDVDTLLKALNEKIKKS